MKIVLAEDIGVTRRLFEETLLDMGHEVTAVADGDAALAAVRRVRPPLVIVDWLMPKLDGLQVCSRIREMDGGREVFILMQTGRGTSEDLAAALARGVDDYITKPVNPDHLRARVAIAETRIAQNAARWRAEEKLARVQWLAGVGETSLAMQHEVNNPMTALIAELSFALDSKTLAEQRQAVVAASKQAQRVIAVMKRLSELEDPRSVETLPGVRMLDMRADAKRTKAVDE
jgi:DNA-binding response OmpR family regulator